MIGGMQVTVDRVVRLRDGRSLGYAQYGTRDGFPIYAESEQSPGAFAFTCHSGVTLAAIHASALADLVASGKAPSDEFAIFHPRRFDVPAAA